MFITSKVLNESENVQLIDYQNFDFLTFYVNMTNNKGITYALVCPDPKSMFKTIQAQCEFILAGGGLVRNLDGEILVIYRNKKWDLPKGKVEKGEKIKETAVREVEEECGVKIAKRGKLICKTYHVYEHHQKVCLKQTNWYKMKVNVNFDLVPQIEEGIEKVMWLDPQDLEMVKSNTYSSILRVFKKSKV